MPCVFVCNDAGVLLAGQIYRGSVTGGQENLRPVFRYDFPAFLRMLAVTFLMYEHNAPAILSQFHNTFNFPRIPFPSSALVKNAEHPHTHTSEGALFFRHLPDQFLTGRLLFP